MTPNLIKEHDIVTSTIPFEKIPIGTKGTVVHCYEEVGAFEVEFINKDGESEVKTLLNIQIKKK